MPKPFGGYWFPIAGANCIPNAFAAYRALKASQCEAVRAWINRRVRLLKAEYLLPKGWGEYSGKLHPNEDGPTGSVGVAAPGGPEGSAGSTGGGT
jgi:hypothetical protein